MIAYRYFAVVNTFSNAAGELASERLFPEPYVWDDDNVPPMPTDPLPHCYMPFRRRADRAPKYLAYVPKPAHYGCPGAASCEGFKDRDTCGDITHSTGFVEAQEKVSKVFVKTPKKRKLDKVDLPVEEAEGESATPLREKKVATGSRTAARKVSFENKEAVEPVKRSQ